MTNGGSSLDDFTNALAPMNKDFFVPGFLTRLFFEWPIGNVIVLSLQSIDRLCFSNQERARIFGFDRVLIMILKII